MNGYRRLVRDIGDGELGMSIPADFLAEHNIRKGDNIAMRKQDADHPVLEVHFEATTDRQEVTDHE